MAQATHPKVFIANIYPEVSPPVQYTALIQTRSRMVASDPDSGCPREPTAGPWSSSEEAMSRARRIAAFEGSLDSIHFPEVMGGNKQAPDSAAKRLFLDTKSNIMTEMYGKGSFITRHVFGVYSTIRVQVRSESLVLAMFAQSLIASGTDPQSNYLRSCVFLCSRRRVGRRPRR